MIADTTKDTLKRRLPEYVNMITQPDGQAGKNKYICPCCHSGAHGGRDSDGAFTLYPEKNSWYCFSCDKGGDIFELVKETQGIALFPDQINYLARIFGETVERDDTQTSKQQSDALRPADPPRKENTAGKYKDFIETAAASADSVREYLHGRGIQDDIIDKYKIGYTSHYFAKAQAELPAVVFCYNNAYSYYSARSLDGKCFAKPKADDAGDEPLYNPAALYDALEPCFVCEGALDALSIIQSGGNACALIGTAWENKLIPQIEKQKPTAPLILCLDHDSAGQTSQGKLAARLDDLDVPYIHAVFAYDKYDGERKDANDLLQSNPAQLRADVRSNKERSLRPDSVASYMELEMREDIKTLQKDAQRKTGFDNLDKVAGSLYSGLYILGGISSVGKTTFVAQMADQMAERGEHVLFFSLEQSRLEMVSKSIARGTALIDRDAAVDSREIRLGAAGGIVTQARDYYYNGAAQLVTVIEGNFDCNVSYIEKYAENYIRNNNARPLIILDYLQILGATLDPETGRKQTDPRVIVNENITGLKRISRRLHLPIIAISSLNRANYLAPLSFESLRESSGLEYTADVVWGIEYTAIYSDTIADPKESLTRKREVMKRAKAADPREVVLTCLKNRYGTDYSCAFEYFPKWDYFRPAGGNPFV